jgi:putative membrane-bound dehydrogenase-like protein
MFSKAFLWPSTLVVIAAVGVFAAEEKFPSFPATEPRDAAKTLRVKNGFTMDLIAAEPLLASPVAIAYDEDGVGYVVEMRDYPYTDKKTHQAYKDNTTDAPIGRVRKLIDRNGDGVFDESHILADGLSWPTGIACWKGGVFVTATPDVWYLKDTDGDHRADVREKVFTGFRKYNVQAVINTPLWGLDNRITFAGGSNGGQVSNLKHPEISPLRVARNDLRINPRTETIEAIAGGARFGHGMDDWGNRFLCNIRHPAQHVVFDGTLSARNPFLPVPNPVYDARESGDTLPVKRISPLEPWRDLRARRWVAENHAVPRSELVGGGVFTSAAGITIYRGAAYPAEYRGQAFVAEVANNLVQRQTVVKDGVTFKIETADKDAEFIASTDVWFRAVNFINAPDGTLHVVDMYRETIEHPWSIPDDIRAKLDLESGRDRGRLYRLSPPGFKVPKPPRLSQASGGELVALLENRNSWWRETAQRLLVERQDRRNLGELRALLERSSFDLARLHALWTLEGLDGLSNQVLERALVDESAGVREHAVRLAAPRIGGSSELRPQMAALKVFDLARDPEIRVRYQVAFAAGGVKSDAAVDAALEILRRDAGDRWVRSAVLSAPPEQCGRIAQKFFADPDRPGGEGGREVVRQLAFVAGAHNQPVNLQAVFAAFASAAGNAAMADVFWTGLGDGLKQAGKNLRSAFPDPQSAGAQAVSTLLSGALRTARSVQSEPAARSAAMKLLAYDDFGNVRSALVGLLSSTETQPVQVTAVKTLAAFTHPEVAKTLLDSWAGATPAVREEILAALLARRDRVGALLTAMENKTVAVGQVSAARRTQILANPDAAIKGRAEKLFGQGVGGSRAEVVARYNDSLKLAGDAKRGTKVYDNVCAACHRFSGRGVDIGPNLESVRGWDREKLVLNILDPNREVAGNYIAYVIDLKDGSSVSGMISEENAASIKLKRIGAAEETILRQNIAKITSSAVSLMPEGLEATLPPQDMADLLAFLAQ